MRLSDKYISQFPASITRPVRLLALRLTNGYSHECIGKVIAALMINNSGSVYDLLQNEHLGLKRAIEKCLLGEPISLVEMKALASVLGNVDIHKYFESWCKNNPMELQGLRKTRGESSYNKIVMDLIKQIIGNKNVFLAWLDALPEKPTKYTKIPGFKSGGLRFTIFGIFLSNGTQLGKDQGIIFSQDISRYVGSALTLGVKKVYEVKKVQRQVNVSNRYYDENGDEFLAVDSAGEPYEVQEIRMQKDGTIRIYARNKHKKTTSRASVKMRVERPNNFSWYYTDSDGFIIPPNNTGGGPSGPERRSEPAGSSAPEEVSPRPE